MRWNAVDIARQIYAPALALTLRLDDENRRKLVFLILGYFWRICRVLLGFWFLRLGYWCIRFVFTRTIQISQCLGIWWQLRGLQFVCVLNRCGLLDSLTFLVGVVVRNLASLLAGSCLSCWNLVIESTLSDRSDFAIGFQVDTLMLLPACLPHVSLFFSWRH